MYGQPLVWSIAAVAVLAVIAVVFYSQGERIDDLERQRTRDVATLSEQVRALGGVPKVTPSPSPPPASSGRDGRDGKDGATPSQAQIASLVARYLRENPPRDGRDPTMAEILTAVTGYLREHPPPAGPSGAPGADGKDGVDGTDGQDGKDGKDGADATDEQVRAAVAAYLETHTFTCTPEDVTGPVTGGPFRCSVSSG